VTPSRRLMPAAESSPTAPNPLLDRGFPIPFHRIRADHVVPGVRTLLRNAGEAVEALAAGTDAPSWEGTIGRFDALTERVRRGTGPVQHLLAVAESPELRRAWNEVLPEVSAFWSRLYLHTGVWARLVAFAGTAEAAALDPLRRRHLERTLRDFRRSGVELPAGERARLEAIEVELSGLQQKFSENVLDATAAYSLHVEDEGRLEGIPDDARSRFRQRAEADGREGWLLTLDHPSYEAVLKHARDRELRREIHHAFLARGAREPWDNRPLIPRILRLRTEKALLLGFPDFSDYRLEEQMARTGARAREFVEEMVARTRPHWEADLEALRSHARERGLDRLRPWDASWLMEDLRKARFDLDEEELRPYFPLERVLQGLFTLAERVFGLRVEERRIQEVWHPDVRYFHLLDRDGELVGAFYADFFPRPEKRQGAWMNDFIYGQPGPDGPAGPHLGGIAANFPPPGEDRPALLGHRDVETLFHEFGHLLHHCASRVPIEGRGGINVAWDWVEVPSQLMENWTWEREALDLLTSHWKSGEPLPEELHRRMIRARRFMGGWRQMRQLGFGSLDLALHTAYDPDRDGDPVEWVTERLVPLSPDRAFAAAHPLPSFLHLFPGGYAASYYAYMWSEVLEADLFTRFLKEGVFNHRTGRAYVEAILSQGDREDPEVLFRRFMGRDPDPEALIRRNLGETVQV
jgi:oligopeptidase A